MNSLYAMAFLLALFWPFGSGKNYVMQADSSVPAATGTVNVTRNKQNRNTQLDIKVNHLAAPSSLTPSESAYIVWVQPNGHNAEKRGAIGVGNNLKGELKTVTTAKNFEVFITAEPGVGVTQPSGLEVLKAHVSLP